MGCCASTNNTSSPPKTYSKSSTKQTGDSKSPPPAYIEEETVKEVLSEIPAIFKHPAASAPRFHDQNHPNENADFFEKPFMIFGNDERSAMASEIGSTLSENASVSTTITEKREDNGEFDEIRRRSPARFRNRSFPGEAKREKTAGKSPSRRSEPSPSRTGHGPGNDRRRNNGDSWGRRSRSPVMRTDSGPSKTGLGCSHSLRKADKSPGRVGSGLAERIRKVDEGKEGGENTWPPTSNELLENPLVSLECFIFL